ncbi:hypothetical protein BC937DRAFT_88981 [Endogone sp. FLAS-F59071]|nr:hypothetical protein BC937DRAFT_88981 [Endogone sp. FLAS-F59071]|eukprot:RUS18258.1 hypothetical protein BC937DRAFT_88981 [Endogone sp. FLAS-F59071]
MPPTVIPNEEFDYVVDTDDLNNSEYVVNTGDLDTTPLSSPTPSTGSGTGNPLDNIRDELMVDIPEMYTDMDGGFNRDAIDLGITFSDPLPAESASPNATREENGLESTISNLYRMLFLYKDNGVNGLVDKVILSRPEMERFCNDVVPGSFRSLTDVDYSKLCKHSLRYIGVYGNPIMIALLLYNIQAISKHTLQILGQHHSLDSKQDTPLLSAGIYLYHHKPTGCGLVIHWPERGSFASNASSDKKKNMINFQRYLCKLTDRQVCLMSKDDVDAFNWKTDEPHDFMDVDYMEDNCFEFEVKKNQEQKEDFTFREGFQIPIPSTTDNNEISQSDDLDLHPEIVESRQHQTLVTKQLIPASVINTTKSETISCSAFEQKMRNILPTHQLILPDNITLDELALFVKHAGLSREVSEQCFPVLHVGLRDIQQQFNNRECKINQDIKNDIEAAKKWAVSRLPQILLETYPTLVPHMNNQSLNNSGDRTMDKTDNSKETDQRDQLNAGGGGGSSQDSPTAKTSDLNGIDEAVLPPQLDNPEFHNEFREHFSYVGSTMWKKKKKRFFLSQVLASCILEGRKASLKKDTGDSPAQDSEYALLVSRIFFDEEMDYHVFVRKHLSANDSWIEFFKNLGDFQRVEKVIRRAEELKRTVTDPEFATMLFGGSLLAPDIEDSSAIPSREEKITQVSGDLLNTFASILERWACTTLDANLKELVVKNLGNQGRLTLDNLRSEVKTEIASLEQTSRSRIRQLLIDRYNSGHTLEILKIKEHTYRSMYSYTYGNPQIWWEYQLETARPPKVRVTFYETRLDQADVQKLTTEAIDEVDYTPSPQFYTCGSQKPPTFEYDYQIYNMRKLYQLDNGKFLCFLHNHHNHMTELFYEKASRIGTAVANSTPFRKFQHEFELTAYEDVNGLLAVYSSETGTLNVFSFDEGKDNLFLRNANIQILPWYNNVAPELSQILFVNGTEDLCFVETNGRMRVYSLVTGQFQPLVAELPHNSEVRCSPDGACLIAFVGKRDGPEDMEGIVEEEKEDDDKDEDVRSLGNSIEMLDVDLLPFNAIKKDKEGDLGHIEAHVYFVKNLSVASKVVQLPGIGGDARTIKLSALAGRQIHLLYLSDSQYIASKILRITVEKNEWHFNETNKATLTLGKVRCEHPILQQDIQIIEGSGTTFTKFLKLGDLMVIRGEKRSVKEIVSDTRLIIEGSFSTSLRNDGSADKLFDFKVERKPDSNGYVDCYSGMYQRYPVDSCIRDNSAISVSALYIFLEVSRQELDNSRYAMRFSEYIGKAFNELIKSTNKPADSLKYFAIDTKWIESMDILNLCLQSKVRPIGQWLVSMACLLPIQIAIAMDNHFLPLKDGVITDMDAMLGGAANLTNVSENITFGWYESVFSFYGDYDVKVVSSMGEQSTGKSYLLNHLCGSTFEGSAQRCTEGVWMSLVPTEKTLYVVMDFEGLRSLERTPQEDLFLMLFNAAVSNLILYKNNFALGRDISSMFHRFQDGATIFDPSTTSSMFTSRLAIVIKDVPKQDRVGIVQEFKNKFSQIVSEEGEDNFISRLHKGQMSILPWPVFNDSGFYSMLNVLKKYLDEQESKFGKARIFLPTVKTIMAKLKVCDWSSLDNNMVQIRATAVRFLIKPVIATGVEEMEPTMEPLRNRDTGANIQDEPVLFGELFDTLEDMPDDKEIMPDTGLILLPTPAAPFRNFRDFTAQLRKRLEDNVQERAAASSDSDWYKLYSAFVKFAITRRIRRAEQWFLANTNRFQSDHSEIMTAAYELEQECDKLAAFWSLCGLTCVKCNLRCLEQRDHSDDHDCYTDHQCKHGCDFTQDHFPEGSAVQGLIPPCGQPAGHDGAHVCVDSEHLCGEPCALYGKRNCQGSCTKQSGHLDESHTCASRVHYCGMPCSLSDVKDSKSNSLFCCKNTCIFPCEEDHVEHKCENAMACPLRCCMPQCNKKCASNDHFHAITNPTEYHICGDEHQCFEECEAEGVCEIQIQPKAQEEHYVNMHGSFAFTKYVQTSRRLGCFKKVPAGLLTHSGKHAHASVDRLFHFCETKCPFCEYYCTLPYGHPQMEHETSHGNMTQTVFSSMEDEFEHSGFTFNTGDRGICFLCNMFCKDFSRHKHIDYCQNADPTICGAEGLQHIMQKVSPNPDRPKDFVKHSLFWKRTGFKDPYSKDDQEFFGKCDALCYGEEHNVKANQGSSTAGTTGIDNAINQVVSAKSYCELPLFHAPLVGGSPPPNGGVGYVSVDGHYFKCQNPATALSDFHIIFAIDRSSSMTLKDMRPLRNTPVYRLLAGTHNNRLGAVYDAINRFLETRLTTLRNRATGASMPSPAVNDKISLVLFNHSATTIYANRDLSTGSAGFITQMSQHTASGGTSFAQAMNEVTNVCIQHHDPSRVPIIIFLSDGEDSCPQDQLQQLFDTSAQIGAKPFLTTVLFGTDTSGRDVLKAMADYAEKHHQVTPTRQYSGNPQARQLPLGRPSSSSGFRCGFYNALDEVQLAEYFTGLAQSLKECKPALMRR